MVMSSIKANPARWVFQAARGIFQRFRGESRDRTVRPTETVRDRYINQAVADNIPGLAEQVASGKIRTDQWLIASRLELRRTYINQYLLAKGGRQNMTGADWSQLQTMLQKQYQHLDKFAQDINAGKLSGKQIHARANLYIQSGRQAYEQGKGAAMGVPTLPAYPGDGSTQCVTNCQCHWEITETDEEWAAYWTLGAAEHCPDCVQRARDWAPYRLPKEANYANT